MTTRSLLTGVCLPGGGSSSKNETILYHGLIHGRFFIPCIKREAECAKFILSAVVGGPSNDTINSSRVSNVFLLDCGVPKKTTPFVAREISLNGGGQRDCDDTNRACLATRPPKL
jgi:hypothetical protein